MTDAAPERVALIRSIMFMKVKDRVKLGLKGTRARNILIRDSNKTVSTAVIHNPKITDQEVEAIAAMRTVSDEVLRLVALNRAWARSYAVIHHLARNPRTPLPTAMGVLPRLQTRDLKGLIQNRNNVSEPSSAAAAPSTTARKVIKTVIVNRNLMETECYFDRSTNGGLTMQLHLPFTFTLRLKRFPCS